MGFKWWVGELFRYQEGWRPSQSKVSMAGIVKESLLEEEKVNLGLGCNWEGKGTLGRRNNPSKSLEEGKCKVCSGHREETSLTGWNKWEAVEGTTKLKAYWKAWSSSHKVWPWSWGLWSAMDRQTRLRKETWLMACLSSIFFPQCAQPGARREGLGPIQDHSFQERPTAAAGRLRQPPLPGHQGLCDHPRGHS